MGVDVINKGMGGSCLCEKAMAEYIARDKDWNFITLELGVNMRTRFTANEFEEHASYLINIIKRENPIKHIFLITIFPNYAGYYKDKDRIDRKNELEFNEVIRKIHREIKDDYVHLIEGSELLKDLSGLTCDLIHPSDYGHMAIGKELANKMNLYLLNG